MRQANLPLLALAGLGLTQIIGYGTLFYSFSILVPDIARDLGWSPQWVFGALSAALLAGGLVAPTAGRLADRHGAGRVMSAGSIAASTALLACALAPGRITFAAALLAMEISSSFVLYSTAFVAVVQFRGPDARRTITHLTLIAGFASTIFWPLTSLLHEHMSWRSVYMAFAAANLFVCLPVHAWIARLLQRAKSAPQLSEPDVQDPGAPAGPGDRRMLFTLMLAGFGIEGLVLSSILTHMVPLTSALGLGTAGILVASLFGPAQVASRFANMLFGRQLPQSRLALVAATLLPMALAVLATTTPSVPGAVIFAVLFGMGSGLASIVGGTLPLELFGRDGYGARLGWVTAVRQLSSAVAPFALSLAMASVGIMPALWISAAVGSAGILAFAMIAVIVRRAGFAKTLTA